MLVFETMHMFDRESFKLIGLVKSVTAEFSTLEIVDGEPVVTRTDPAGYLRFDRKGCLLEEISTERELMDDVNRDVYIYNADGSLAEREEYLRDGSLRGKTYFEFDSNGGRIERHFYVSIEDKQLTLGSELTFDAENKYVSCVNYYPDGRVVPPQKYSTPPNREEKNVMRTEDGYIEDEIRFDYKDQLIVRKVTHYNKRGEELEFVCYDSDGMYNNGRFEYEFDEVGNWIVNVYWYWVIGWGEYKLIPFTKTIRRIEYYA